MNNMKPDLALENRVGISTRSKTALLTQNNVRNEKRKADVISPPYEKPKRSALGNLTNANALNILNEKNTNVGVQKTLKKNHRPIVAVKEENENVPIAPINKSTKIQRRASIRAVPQIKCDAIKIKPKVEPVVKPTRRLSTDFEKSENSLYVSALEELTTTNDPSNYQTAIGDKFQSSHEKIEDIPEGVTDFDQENWNDPFQVSNYAMDIFNYLKDREKQFTLIDYMPKQIHLSKWMRALLIDWMVEVQESFELNHETLYLAVKLVDKYLCTKIIQKDSLQLLGAASLLIACKFDERTPPMIEDFLYICDGAYKKKELLVMEVQLLKTIEYDLSMPLSYRFLRRYARCAKVSMPILTLARFILEYSLMDYATIQLSDSKLACAALFIALRMNKMPGWSLTLEYYSGYKVQDLKSIIILLNNGLNKKPKESLNTIRNKYSHKIFHEVAKIPLLANADLLKEEE